MRFATIDLMYKFKNDQYKRARGGSSRVLSISCQGCGERITHYQKDGPGELRRMYLDRFIDFEVSGDSFDCPSCNRNLGILIDYKKESRPAYRLFVGAVSKRIVSAKTISKTA